MRVRGISDPQMVVARVDGNHYKYELSIPHQFLITNLDLLIYDVCVLRCTLGHIPRYMGRIIKCQDNNFLCCFANLVISLVLPHLLSFNFTSDSGFMIITILYLLTSCFTTCVLFYQSPALILSYHECSLLNITCYISIFSCMLVLTTRFQYMFMNQIYRYTCTYLSTPFGIASPLAGEF